MQCITREYKSPSNVETSSILAFTNTNNPIVQKKFRFLNELAEASSNETAETETSTKSPSQSISTSSSTEDLKGQRQQKLRHRQINVEVVIS